MKSFLKPGCALALAMVVAAGSRTTASAEEQRGSQGVESNVLGHPVVFRVSDVMLSSLLSDEDFDRETEVRDVILGTTIRGRARILGKPGVQLVESPDQATFYITFNGTVNSRTTGYNGPAIIYSRSVTTFTATKRVVFEAGKGFVGLPSQVTARTQTFVEGIGSTRGGLIGHIVRRRAAKIEAERHDEATEIARQKVERRIAVAFEKQSEERLARLSWVTRLRLLAAATLRVGGSVEPRYTFSTTRNYLQIAPHLSEESVGIRLPLETVPLAGQSPVEVWVHQSFGGERLARALGLLDTAQASSSVIDTVAAAARLAVGNAGMNESIAEILDANRMQLHKTGDWQVIVMPQRADAENALAGTGAAPAAQATERRASPDPGRQLRVASNRRIWTSGKYQAEAEFLEVEGEMVRLRRANGVRTTIPLVKLSRGDQEWIASHGSGR